MVNGTLPDGWEWIKLQDLSVNPRSDIVDGPFGSDLKATEYVDSGVPIIRLQNIDRNHFIDKNIRFVTPEKAERLKRHSFVKGDIVITKLGDPLGKACIVPEGFEHGIIVADVVRARVNLDVVNKQYLVHAINSQQVIEQLEPLVKGSTRPRVNLGHVRDLLIPIAPLPEQERIVSRIEELFSDLHAGVAALERAQIGLQRYKASVLKAAIEGRLLESRKVESGDELPVGWLWARAEDICGFITKGTTPKSDKLFAGSGEVPFIKVYNLTFDGSLDFSINPTFVSKETHTGELARSKIIPGDVLMNIVGPPLGKVSIVPDTFPEWNMNQAVARFRPLEICDKKYLSIALRTESVLSWAVKRAKATAGQFNLTLEICRNLPIPLPPLDEQRRIVAEVERRLSVVGEVESAVEVGLVRAGRLRQSVLRSAFEGRL